MRANRASHRCASQPRPARVPGPARRGSPARARRSAVLIALCVGAIRGRARARVRTRPRMALPKHQSALPPHTSRHCPPGHQSALPPHTSRHCPPDSSRHCRRTPTPATTLQPRPAAVQSPGATNRARPTPETPVGGAQRGRRRATRDNGLDKAVLPARIHLSHSVPERVRPPRQNRSGTGLSLGALVGRPAARCRSKSPARNPGIAPPGTRLSGAAPTLLRKLEF